MASAENSAISTRLSNTKSVTGAITAFLVCAMLYLTISQLFGGNRVINSVKKAHHNSYSNITFEEAYSKFYANPEWKYVKLSTGDDCVVFTGQCTYDNITAKIVLRFIVYNNYMHFAGGSINGVELDAFTINRLYTAPFDQY